uniref:Centromere protein U n=1 Tax=Tetraodon nigroviridis TaxID=99883 RepID=H3C1N1_TETNG
KRTSADHQWRGGQGTRQRPELELILDAFADYIDRYRESVDSEVVKRSISSFSSIVKEQLEEKICCSKELKVLKKNNAKVRSLGQTTTQRLLNTKYELMRAERQIFLLQKEQRERELRLSDLRTGQTFLHDLFELNRQYLDYRRKNSEEDETYGASALPALVQEVSHLQSTEAQLRDINNRLEKLIEQ